MQLEHEVIMQELKQDAELRAIVSQLKNKLALEDREMPAREDAETEKEDDGDYPAVDAEELQKGLVIDKDQSRRAPKSTETEAE